MAYSSRRAPPTNTESAPHPMARTPAPDLPSREHGDELPAAHSAASARTEGLAPLG